MTGATDQQLTRLLAQVRAGKDRGLVVVPSPYCATPSTLLASLARSAAPTTFGRDHVETGLLLDAEPVVEAVREGRLDLSTWHPFGAIRELVNDKPSRYLRLRASELAAHLNGHVDVALVRVGPPDRHGRCSLGPSGSITQDLVAAAAVTIAEIDPGMPTVAGPAASIALSDLDLTVDTDQRPVWPRQRPPSPDMLMAAENVARLIPDGAAVQLGIGALPEAVGQALARQQRHGLSIVGMASQASVDLLRHGMVDERGVRAVEILGDDEVISEFDHNPAFELHSSRTLHSPVWLGGVPGLVSVCTGLRLDQSGNVASERVGDRLLSGIGGSLDFVEAANRSDGGLVVMAFTSRAAGGHAVLVEALPAGEITIPGRSIDIVVTEHGVADLRTVHDPQERSACLRAIFSPTPVESFTV